MYDAAIGGNLDEDLNYMHDMQYVFIGPTEVWVGWGWLKVRLGDQTCTSSHLEPQRSWVFVILFSTSFRRMGGRVGQALILNGGKGMTSSAPLFLRVLILPVTDTLAKPDFWGSPSSGLGAFSMPSPSFMGEAWGSGGKQNVEPTLGQTVVMKSYFLF